MKKSSLLKVGKQRTAHSNIDLRNFLISILQNSTLFYLEWHNQDSVKRIAIISGHNIIAFFHVSFLMQIPLARSAVHLTEVLEGVCNQMSNYASSTNADGRRSYVRTNSRDGSAVSLTNIEITGEVHSQLKFAVEYHILIYRVAQK